MFSFVKCDYIYVLLSDHFKMLIFTYLIKL